MYRLLVDLFQPYTILLLWICWALFSTWRQHAETKRRLWPLVLPLLIMAALCTPAAAHLALLSLESYSQPLEDRPRDAGAVVVFPVGVHPPDAVRARPEMDEDTLQRCLDAARLYHQGAPCLVLASGGRADPDAPSPPYAAVMGDFLRQLGVQSSDLVQEEASQTTYENAAECARILKERGIGRVVLVVDAVDMRRAAGCLRKQGVEVIPAPSHFRATRFGWSVAAFVPDPRAAEQIQRVWHEWVGTIWYWIQGRL